MMRIRTGSETPTRRMNPLMMPEPMSIASPKARLIDDMKLVDFKVRITNGGTEAVTRVIIDSEDDQGRRWSTVGVSANIVDASFEALLDAIQWKLIRDFGAKK